LISIVEIDLGKVLFKRGVLPVQAVGLLHLDGGFFPVAQIAQRHGVIVLGMSQLILQTPVSRFRTNLPLEPFDGGGPVGLGPKPGNARHQDRQQYESERVKS